MVSASIHRASYFAPMSQPFCALVLSLGFILMAGCSQVTSSKPEEEKSTDEVILAMIADSNRLEIQGHRGARGLMPENTVPGFVLAIQQGADVLELDLCIAADGIVIVSHEPWMSHEICRSPDGRDISFADERNHNLYQMSLEEMRAYDCGSRIHPRFPEQRPLAVSKPTLAEVVKMVEKVPLLDGGILRYNMEIKHRPDFEPEYCPDAETFTALVVAQVQQLGIANRTCIQSFSEAAMEAVHQLAPEITTAWLTDTEGSVQSQLDRLSFQPDIYSPNWKLIDATDVKSLQDSGIRVIPWTVNSQEDLHYAMQLGVDGIITDFPGRLYDMR